MPSSDQKKKWAKTHRITPSEDPREVELYGKDWAEANVEQGLDLFPLPLGEG